jgi:putative phosphoesterase
MTRGRPERAPAQPRRGAGIRVGVISDTHGLLRPEARQALVGCDRLIHAGDIGRPEVLEELRSLAPIIAIRGNVDRWALALPDTEVADIAGHSIYVLHDLKSLDLDPAAAGFAAVVSGHSHQPRIGRREGVLYLNPGSAGPRRFKLPVAVAILDIDARGLDARIVELAV